MGKGTNPVSTKGKAVASPNVAQPASGALAQNDNPDLTRNQNETSSDESSEKVESIVGLMVQSKRDGFRRAGIAWSTTPTFIALTDLTDEQVKALEDEPMLSVSRSAI